MQISFFYNRDTFQRVFTLEVLDNKVLPVWATKVQVEISCTYIYLYVYTRLIYGYM